MSLAEKSTEFVNYLEQWLDSRPRVKLSEVISEPEESAIISIDVINAFLYEGPLSSPRVHAPACTALSVPWFGWSASFQYFAHLFSPTCR